MIVTIENEFLSVSAESAGAQLKSIRSKKSGREYLWQGDPAYWTGRAYNLFPFIGRLTENTYTYCGEKYEMLIHGFVRRSELTLKEHSADKMVFHIGASDVTKAQYPFLFSFDVSFALAGNKLEVAYTIVNEDEKEIIFGVGGHPGFNVPFGVGSFEEYYVEFPLAKEPLYQPLMSDACYMTGEKRAYPLAQKRVPLRHDLFDRDVIILENTGGFARIGREGEAASIGFSYPDMKYLGLWHKPKTDAPFLCLEPWSALPARDGVIEDLATKADMTHLASGATYRNAYCIQIDEE